MKFGRAILFIYSMSIFMIPLDKAHAQLDAGTDAPEWRLEGLDEKWVSLSEFKEKVVLLYFMGYACQFCQLTAPYVESIIWKEYKDSDDVRVIAIDTWDGTPNQVQTFFINQTKVTFPVYMNGSEIAVDYKVGYDWFVILDQELKVAYARAGILTYEFAKEEDIVNELKNEIDKLLTVTAIGRDESAVLPGGYELAQNYPNPFNPLTTISFSVPARSHAKLEIFDLRGRLIRTLVNGSVRPGNHDLFWHGTDEFNKPVASGIYFYRLSAQNGVGAFSRTNKMILMK